jgi:hypothetical protein
MLLEEEDATRSVSSREATRLKRNFLADAAPERRARKVDVEVLLHSAETDETTARALLDEVRACVERSIAGAAGGIARVDARLLTSQPSAKLAATVRASALDAAIRARGLHALPVEEVENQLARQLLANYKMVLQHFYNPQASPLILVPDTDITISFEVSKRRMRVNPPKSS